MRITLHKWILVLTLASAASIAWPAAAQNAPGSIAVNSSGITYYAQSGDTLISIARQLTTRTANWVALGKLNQINKDSSIPIGTGIIIPADLLANEPAEATIIARTGDITATAADGTPIAIDLGTKVAEGTRISTGNNSFITLSLADASRISLPSNSSVQFARLRKTLYTGSPLTEVKLLRGKVVSRVSPLDVNKGRFEVRTPLSVAGVRGTYFRVGLNGRKTVNEVLEGHVAISSLKTAETRMLNPAKGNVIDRDAVGPAINLLPSPELAKEPYLHAGITQFSLMPVATAQTYHLQIGRDAELLQLLAEAQSKTGNISLDNIKEGNYFVRLSAIDKLGLEGIPRTVAITIRNRAHDGEIPAQAAPSVAQGDDKDLFLQWSGSANKRYKIQVARDPDFSWLLFSKDVTGSKIRFPRPSFGTYFARVQSINADGSINPFSFTQTLLVTDQWIINDGHPLAPKETPRNAAR